MSMKLFASDYDGTFYKHQNRKRLELRNNISSVQDWQAAGNFFIFATGRSISMMKFEKKTKGLKYDYIVGLNGGIIVSKTDQVLYRKDIEPNIARGIIELVKKHQFNNYCITDGFTGHYQFSFKWRKKSAYFLYFAKLFLKAYRLTLEEALAQQVTQIAVETKGPEDALAFAKLINETFNGEVTAFANLHHVDISAANLSKATGIDYVAKLHQIKNKHVFGMGDSYNDVPMFKEYHGFTLPEARTEIKNQAETVYETVGAALTDLLNQAK